LSKQALWKTWAQTVNIKPFLALPPVPPPPTTSPALVSLSSVKVSSKQMEHWLSIGVPV
jgi:hypothetical protein